MLALLSLIPGLLGVVERWQANALDAKVRITMARTGADRDVAVEMVKATAIESTQRVAWMQAVAQSRSLQFLVVGFALPLMLWVWKCVVWDTVLGLGTTEPLRGQLAEWANQIIWCIFGTGGAAAVANAFYNRKRQE